MNIHAVAGLSVQCMPFNITIFKFYTSIIIHYTQNTAMHLSQARIQEFSSGGMFHFRKYLTSKKKKINKKK